MKLLNTHMNYIYFFHFFFFMRKEAEVFVSGQINLESHSNTTNTLFVFLFHSMKQCSINSFFFFTFFLLNHFKFSHGFLISEKHHKWFVSKVDVRLTSPSHYIEYFYTSLFLFLDFIKNFMLLKSSSIRKFELSKVEVIKKSIYFESLKYWKFDFIES